MDFFPVGSQGIYTIQLDSGCMQIVCFFEVYDRVGRSLDSEEAGC